jgi:SAM-dependent methyltransferase
MMERFREGCDIVAASRFMPNGKMVGCRWLKATLVRTAAFLLYHGAGVPTHDATNGFRLFSRRVVKDIPIESTQGFTYSLELLAKAHRRGWKIAEVPVQWFERRNGTSRFRVFHWLPHYLRWFLHCFGTALWPRASGERASATVLKPQAEKTFFDRFVDAHGDYDVLDENAYARLLLMFGAVHPQPHETCVDLGCGTGAFTRRLQVFDLDLLGIDISSRSVEAARAHAHGKARQQYLVGDIRHLDIPAQSADIVVFSGVLHHVPESPLRAEILSEAFRVLRPGGRIFAYDPSAHSPSMWLYRSPGSPFHSKAGKTENEVLLTRGQLRGELAYAGFEKIEVRGVGGITYRYVEGRMARALLPLYNIYERVLQRTPVEHWLGTFLISSARKPSQA